MRRFVRSISGSARRGLLVLVAGTGAAGAIVLSAIAVIAQQQDFRSSPFLRIDPERIVLSERDSRVPCGECHVSEYEVWRQTEHATGFDDLHRTESARDILERMGLAVTKRQESICMRCHYTVGAELRAIAGVSCESCHGPARDWVNVHNQWGEGIDHPDREAPEHRQQRIAQSVEGGMLRPSGNLYAVAANCFECHTVPMEELVNRGGHAAGSARFDLVERTAEIRHNFLMEQWGGAAVNREPTPERTRLVFATGRILAYEFAVRGLAVATTGDRYFKSMERRAQQAYRELEAVARAADVPAIIDILAIGAELKLVPDNGPSLLQAADSIRAAGQAFALAADGATLAGLDPLVAGGPAPDVAEPDPAAAAPTPPPAPGQPTPRPDPPTGAVAPPTPPPAEAAPAAATPDLPGRVRSRPEWFPAVDGRYRTVLPGCSCHTEAEDWWLTDEHAASANRLVQKEPRAREIAQLYGVGVDQMARGDRMCMSCHGTAESDAPTATVLEGVSCERCHGGSSEWLEPHEEGGNPQLGMTALKNADVRARTCAGCHRISDERLLAAGHPSGSDYDIVAANRDIMHYPDRRTDRGRRSRGEGAYPAVADATLQSTFAGEVARRPIPQVTVVSLPSRASAPPPAAARGAPPATATAGPGVRPDEVRSRGEARVSSLPPRPPATRRPNLTTASPTGALDLEPLPAVTDTLTSEDLLLLVKRRLERLYALLGRGS